MKLKEFVIYRIFFRFSRLVTSFEIKTTLCYWLPFSLVNKS